MVKKLILILSALLSLLFVGITDEDTVDVLDQLKQAEAYVKDSQYEQAESIYKTIIADYPDTDYAFQAQKNLVIVYVATDNQPEAEVALQQLLTEFSTQERLPHSIHEITERCCNLGKGDAVKQLHQDILNNQPQSNEAIWLQMGVVHSSVYRGDDPNAEAATEALIAEFSENEFSAEAVAQIAWSYRKQKRYEKARQLYQFVVDNWLHKYRAIFSLRGVARCNIALGNEKAAWAAVERLLGEFSENEHIAEAVSSIAGDYRKLEKYKEARILHQYVLDNCRDSGQAIWSQRGVILANIALGDDPNAEAGIQTLFSNFSDHKDIPKVVYQVARKLKNDERAGALYQYVVDNHPDSELTVLSLANIGSIYIRLADFDAAQSILDKLLIDFSDHPILPKAIAVIWQGYYSEALRIESEGIDVLPKWYYQKAIAECERILTQLPETPYTTAEACYFLAVCHERLGEYAEAIEFYQRQVNNWPDYEYTWHAMFRIGCGYEKLKKSGLISELEADAIIRSTYEQLLEEYPTCIVATHTQAWLSRHQPLD